MGFGDYWIQHHNKKERLKAPDEAFGKERLEPKYAHLFDFFDKDGNGKLNAEEMEFLAYSLSAATDDKVLTSAESKNSIFSDLGEEKADFLEFVKAISDAVKFSKTEVLPNGEKRIITEYENGTTDTIYYYPDGEFKFKLTEKKNFITVDNPVTEHLSIGDGKTIAKVKHNYQKIETDPDRFVYLSERATHEVQLKSFIFQHFIDTNKDAQKAINSVEFLDRTGNLIKEGLEAIGLGKDTNNLSEMEDGIEANKSKVNDLEQFTDVAVYSNDFYFGNYEDRFKSVLNHDYSPEKAAEFQELTTQYQTATYLNQCIDLISRALRELANYETDYYQLQTQMPGDNFNPTSHINTVVEILTQLFDNKEIAEAMVNQMGVNEKGKFDISDLVEQLKEMKEANKSTLAETLGDNKYEELKEKYIQEYKSMYNADTVPEEVLDKVMTSKEIGGIVKIAIIMAIQMAITKQISPVLAAGGTITEGAATLKNLNAFQKVIQGLIKAHGVEKVASGVNFAVQAGFVPADIGLGLISGMTSENGLTTEKMKEVLIGGMHSAKYVTFGWAVTGPMSQMINQGMSKIGLGSRLFNGIKPMANGQKVISGADFISKLNSGFMHYASKGVAFTADGVAFGIFDAATGDLDLAEATENAFKMQLELGVARHFLETLLGVKVHAKIAKAKQTANVKDIKIIQDTNGPKPKYTVQNNGNTLFETDNIDIATSQVSIISQVGIDNYQKLQQQSIPISQAGQRILDEMSEILKSENPNVDSFYKLLDETKQLENPTEVWAISFKIVELVREVNERTAEGVSNSATRQETKNIDISKYEASENGLRQLLYDLSLENKDLYNETEINKILELYNKNPETLIEFLKEQNQTDNDGNTYNLYPDLIDFLIKSKENPEISSETPIESSNITEQILDREEPLTSVQEEMVVRENTVAIPDIDTSKETPNENITVFDELEVDIANIKTQRDIEIVQARLLEHKAVLTPEEYTTLETKLNDCITNYPHTVTPETIKQKGLVLESWEQKSARLEDERRTRVAALDKMTVFAFSTLGKMLDNMIDTLDIKNESDVARFKELLNDEKLNDYEKEYFATLLENRLNPPTIDNYTPEQIAAETWHLMRHYMNRNSHLIEKTNDSGLSNLGLVSQRFKSDTSTYDKLFNYIKDHKDKTLIDALEDVRDEFGTRSLIDSGNYSDKPNVKLWLDAAKEEGLTAEEKRNYLIRAAREAATYQSENLLLALQDQMIKQSKNPDGLKGIRMVNYTSADGIPVFSETQLWELYRFAEELGIKKDHIKIIELKEVKYPNGEIQVQAKDIFTKEVVDKGDYTTHSQKSGYTAFQMNFETKKGEKIEFQCRDILTDEFGEAEHLIYDTMTGKDIIGRHPEVKSLCNQLLQVLDKNYLDERVCKKYRTEYLKDYYTYCRAKSLGIDIGEPKLQEYAKRFGKELGIPDLKLDPRLDARNLMALHDIISVVKQNLLSEYEGVELYQKHVSYSQGEVPKEVFEADVESFWKELQDFEPNDIKLEDLKKCSQQDFLAKLEAFKILKKDFESAVDWNKGAMTNNIIQDITAENMNSTMKMYNYLKEAKIPGSDSNNNLYTATQVKPESAYEARIFLNTTKWRPELQALDNFYELIEDAPPELIQQRTHVFQFLNKHAKTHEKDLLEILQNADLYHDTYKTIEDRIMYDETLTDSDKETILKSIPYTEIQPKVLAENLEHMQSYILKAGDVKNLPQLCSILEITPPKDKSYITNLFLNNALPKKEIETYAYTLAAQQKFYNSTPQNQYTNKKVIKFCYKKLSEYGFKNEELSKCSVETLSQLYYYVTRNFKNGEQITAEEKQTLLNNNIDRRISLLKLMPRCYQSKLMLCSDEEFEVLSKKIINRQEYSFNKDFSEENIDKLNEMPDEKYQKFIKLFSFQNNNISNEILTELLKLSDAELDNAAKRWNYLTSRALNAKEIIPLLKLSDKEYEKKITSIPARPIGNDIDPEAYRAEVQAKLDGTYELDMSAYNQSRAKRAADRAKTNNGKTIVTFTEEEAIIPTPKAESSTATPPSEQLIKQLNETGTVSVSIPVQGEFHPKGDDSNGRIEPERKLGEFSTGITLHYGEGRNWDNSRFARDMLQNFYDGNGHTLEGVDIEVKFENGRYKVKISGKGIYDYKQVFKLGKNNHDSLDAGKYGEGMKVMFATLLDSRGATYVKHSSGDWTINLTAEEGARSSSRTRVFGDLQRAETRQQGSSVEFDTTDAELVHELIKAKDYFYTPDNPDFKNFDYENEFFGIKLLPKGQRGNIYVVQRYEVESKEHSGLDDTLEGMTLVFKVMPDNPTLENYFWNKNTAFKLETGRNRVPLTNMEIYQLVRRYAMSIPDADLIRIIGSMKDIYLNPTEKKDKNAVDILDAFALAAHLKNLKIDFGNDNYVSVDRCTTAEDLKFAQLMGKTIVTESMEKVGVPNLREYLANSKKDVLPEAHPTEVQANKIKLIDEAVKLFTENLDLENLDVVTPKEASNPRYIYEKPDRDKNTNEAAEAITDGKNSLGMWIDQKYIDNAYIDIFEYIATWLHEISHKVGGDGEKVFNLRLQRLIQLTSQMCEQDPAFRTKLQVLNQEFKKLNGNKPTATALPIEFSSEEFQGRMEQCLRWLTEDPELPAPKEQKVAILPEDYKPTTLDYIANQADKYIRKINNWMKGKTKTKPQNVPVQPKFVKQEIKNDHEYEFKPQNNTSTTKTPAQPAISSFEELMEIKEKGRKTIEMAPLTDRRPKMEFSGIEANDRARYEAGETEESQMTLNYNSSNAWSLQQVARDMLQNMYDGHRGTLDGVKFDITYENGKFKVRISGQSEYEYFHIENIGASGEDNLNDGTRGGGFGEGAKMVPLHLLYGKFVDKYTYASGDWKIDFTRQKDANGNELPVDEGYMMMTPEINKNRVDGNYVEFETTDENLVKAVLEARDYFYHSNNTDLKDFDIETPDMGFKVLPENKRGNLYYNQRYSVKSNPGSSKNNFEGTLGGLKIAFKRSLSKNELADVSMSKDCDRLGLSNSDVNKIAYKLSESMPEETLMDAIAQLQRYWTYTQAPENYRQNTFEQEFAQGLIRQAIKRHLKFTGIKDLKIACVDHYNEYDKAKAEELIRRGYIIAEESMSRLGFPKINDIFDDVMRIEPHEASELTLGEQQKIVLLELALGISRLSAQKGFQAAIVTFDSSEYQNEVEFYTRDVKEFNVALPYLAIDRKFLRNSDFNTCYNALISQLRRMNAFSEAHFGYQLTRLISDQLRELSKPEYAERLKAIEEEYKKIQ